jgi:cell division protein FtsB
MATSEIFPIFQRTQRTPGGQRSQASPRTKQPVRSASAAVSAQRSGASRSLGVTGAPRSSRPVLGNAQRSAGVVQRSRPPASVQAPQLLSRPRSAVAGRTRQDSRDNHPSRVNHGDRPARRFLLRVGIALLLVAFGLFALAFLGVLPARTYFGQQDELVQKKARLVMLGERNGMLGDRVASLQSDQVVARIARDQFGMVAPGDTLTVLPGLRDGSLSLNGDAKNVVAAVPPADVTSDPALLSSLMHWIRQIVG